MLDRLINHNPDIKKLRDENYEVEIVGNFLLMYSIPYLNAKKEVVKGTLVSNVSIANNNIAPPKSHVVYFIGEEPCNVDGSVMKQLINNSKDKDLGNGINVNHLFSHKPNIPYQSHFDKMTQYIKILSAPAQHYDPQVTAQTGKVIEVMESNSVLNYSDTNSSRAEVDVINQKLSGLKIGIIGLGGTGSYILDFVAKTLVGEIHLFDGDKFLQHNAFRTPGAPSTEELSESIMKVDYLKRIYSKMHKNIISHGLYINESNLGLLNELDFIFVCIDKSAIKKMIFEKLEVLDISFIDTGIGVKRFEDSLLGMIRTTTSAKNKRNHMWEGRVPFADEENDDYSSNIQIAELNALNAVFAIIKWKKLYGFFNDLGTEYDSNYSINLNQLVNNESST